MLSILFNGDRIQLNNNQLSEVVALLPTQRGAVIAVNHKVVRQSEWHTFSLNENDHVDVFQAIAGG